MQHKSQTWQLDATINPRNGMKMHHYNFEASQLWIAILNWCTQLTQNITQSNLDMQEWPWDHKDNLQRMTPMLTFREIWQPTASKPKLGLSPPHFLYLKHVHSQQPTWDELLIYKDETFQARDYGCQEEEQHWNEVWNTPCISNIPELPTYMRFDLQR